MQKLKEARDLARIRKFLARQKRVLFGPAYTAAIQAVRGEVPSRSGAGTLPSEKLQRRVQCLSWPEQQSAALALYHPDCFDLHDQALFYPAATMHPLAYHSSYSHLPWPTTEGTYAIAQQLGYEKLHPRAWCNDGRAGEGRWMIGAWVNDFNLYLKDDLGPYMLFWEVKQDPADHERPGGAALRRRSARAVHKARARAAVCNTYADRLHSRVVQVSSANIDNEVARTLVKLCRAHTAPIDLPETAVSELLHAFREAVGSDTPPRTLANRLGADPAAAKSLMELAVWTRSLRVDLYQPVEWDLPLLPERRDVLTEYAHWFRRQ